MRSIRTWLVLVIALVGLSIAPPASANTSGLLLQNVKGSHGFKGSAVIERFDAQEVNGTTVLTVTGRLTGTAIKNGQQVFISNQSFTALADVRGKGNSGKASSQSQLQAQALTCTILDLDIGRIRLELLGLVINLAPVHLDIDAIPGGGLLGDLLCGLANLLDGLGALNQILALLDQINAILAGL